jgi:hypothetical protein
LAKIAENCDHNIDPWKLSFVSGAIFSPFLIKKKRIRREAVEGEKKVCQKNVNSLSINSFCL